MMGERNVSVGRVGGIFEDKCREGERKNVGNMKRKDIGQSWEEDVKHVKKDVGLRRGFCTEVQRTTSIRGKA